MQRLDPSGQYSDDEVLAALRATDGSRELSYRYERLDNNNKYIEDIDYVIDGQVDNNNLADIKRTAKFTLADTGTLNYLRDRIKPVAQLQMPQESTYDDYVATLEPNIWYKMNEATGSTSDTVNYIDVTDPAANSTPATAYTAAVPSEGQNAFTVYAPPSAVVIGEQKYDTASEALNEADNWTATSDDGTVVNHLGDSQFVTDDVNHEYGFGWRESGVVVAENYYNTPQQGDQFYLEYFFVDGGLDILATGNVINITRTDGANFDGTQGVYRFVNGLVPGQVYRLSIGLNGTAGTLSVAGGPSKLLYPFVEYHTENRLSNLLFTATATTHIVRFSPSAEYSSLDVTDFRVVTWAENDTPYEMNPASPSSVTAGWTATGTPLPGVVASVNGDAFSQEGSLLTYFLSGYYQNTTGSDKVLTSDNIRLQRTVTGLTVGRAYSVVISCGNFTPVVTLSSGASISSRTDLGVTVVDFVADAQQITVYVTRTGSLTVSANQSEYFFIYYGLVQTREPVRLAPTRATRQISGLTPGTNYTVKVWIGGDYDDESFDLGIDGLGQSSVTPYNGSLASYSFVATSSTHTVTFAGPLPGRALGSFYVETVVPTNFYAKFTVAPGATIAFVKSFGSSIVSSELYTSLDDSDSPQQFELVKTLATYDTVALGDNQTYFFKITNFAQGLVNFALVDSVLLENSGTQSDRAAIVGGSQLGDDPIVRDTVGSLNLTAYSQINTPGLAAATNNKISMSFWVAQTAPESVSTQAIVWITPTLGLNLSVDVTSGDTNTLSTALVVIDFATFEVVGSAQGTQISGDAATIFGPKNVTWTVDGAGDTVVYINGVENLRTSVRELAAGRTTVATDLGTLFTANGFSGPGGRVSHLSIYGGRILDRYTAVQMYTLGSTGVSTALSGGEIVTTVENTVVRSGYVEWPQGVFLLTSPTRQMDPTGLVLRDVDAYDQLIVLRDMAVADRYSVPAGRRYTDAISTLASELPSINVVPSTLTLPVPKDWEPGTTYLEIINDLLEAINYESAWFDENGTLICRPYVSPATRGAEYVYATDETSVIHGDVDQTLDLFGVPNKWVLVVSDPDRPAMRGEYTNSNAASPTSTVARGRTIVDFRTEQDAADQLTLDAKAARLAFEASQVYEIIEFNTLGMPIHSNQDTYILQVAGLAVDAKFTEHSWSLDLSSNGTMKHKARRIVQL